MRFRSAGIDVFVFRYSVFNPFDDRYGGIYAYVGAYESFLEFVQHFFVHGAFAGDSLWLFWRRNSPWFSPIPGRNFLFLFFQTAYPKKLIVITLFYSICSDSEIENCSDDRQKDHHQCPDQFFVLSGKFIPDNT
jgi:hypothetical protein